MLINVETLITCKQSCPYMQINRYTDNDKVSFKCSYIGLCKRLNERGTNIEQKSQEVATEFVRIATSVVKKITDGINASKEEN